MPHPTLTALDAQVACYRELAKLADAQHRHVEQGRTDELLDVLQRRQAVLDRIAGHERAIAAAKRDWPAFAASLPAGEAADAGRLLAETRQLLERITAADRTDALILQQRKLDLGRKINVASAAKAVNRNYAAAAYGRRPARVDLHQ